MNERQQALKELSDIRAKMYSLRISEELILKQYGPFTEDEIKAERARVDRNFEAMLDYYRLGGKAWNLEARVVCFSTQDGAREFAKSYPEFTVTWAPA